MKHAQSDKKFFIASCVFHAGIVFALIFSYEFASPLAVVENTNQHDVISAVVLGDTAKSKILPYEEPAAQPKPQPKPEPPKPQPVVKKAPVPPKAAPVKTVDKDAIALKAAEKKLAAKKAQELKNKQKEALAKALMADIKKLNAKKAKKQDEANKFAKMLREQSELSLRQSLMNENIKMRGKEAHYSQGIVNKYQALIQQKMQENWIVPPLVNRSLATVLLIRLAPDGRVLDVTISKSSGDASLDSSARMAVLKSSPLPVPEKADEFEVFRQFSLTASPKNIIQG